MSDSILFVKESKTCSYVLVVNTPRLCGEPGFRSHHDVDEQAHIRCREIINSPNQQREVYSVSEADHPQKIAQAKPVLPSPKSGDKSRPGAAGDDLIRKALQAIKGQGDGTEMVIGEVADDGSFIIEIPDDEGAGGDVVDEEMIQRDMQKIANVLRKAGLDVKGQKPGGKSPRSKDGTNEDGKKKKDAPTRRRGGDDHDEL
ncbi:Protein OS-9 [Marasmius crinis-equi]|uniref:Protein OS-9 n=1 Tax=Marasmius crinis-equi TaxID=585013 RepID=A0ABR3F3Y4_9AGAR